MAVEFQLGQRREVVFEVKRPGYFSSSKPGSVIWAEPGDKLTRIEVFGYWNLKRDPGWATQGHLIRPPKKVSWWRRLLGKRQRLPRARLRNE